MVRLRLIGLVSGEPTEHDGRYVVDYDPRPVRDENGEFVYLISTDNSDLAKQFPSAQEAVELWKSSFGLRPDGKPNAPLSAFTVEIS